LKKNYGFENPFKPDPFSKMILKHLDGGKRPTPGGKRLLDVGCGEGADSVFFARRGYRVTSLDQNQDFLRRFRAYVRGEDPGSISIRRTSVTTYSYPRASFDVIISLLAICCMKRSDVGRVVSGIKKSIRPGGIIAVSARNYLDPEFKEYRRTGKPIERNTFVALDGCGKFLYFLEKNRLKKLFDGFEILYYKEGPAPCKYGEHPSHGDSSIICRRP
jgi:2-polyprenyl-3-methyl-5-hydroxy-6-metoxy-1,4-benzoquinol methylase